MKTYSARFVSLFILLCSSMFSASAFATGPACEVQDATVTSIVTWVDGTTFVILNRENNCGCSQKTRFGIPASATHAKSYIAQAMLAYATDSKVFVYGAGGCTVHGSTPDLYSISLKK